MDAILTCWVLSSHSFKGTVCHSYSIEPRSEHHFDSVVMAILVVLEVLRKWNQSRSCFAVLVRLGQMAYWSWSLDHWGWSYLVVQKIRRPSNLPFSFHYHAVMFWSTKKRMIIVDHLREAFKQERKLKKALDFLLHLEKKRAAQWAMKMVAQCYCWVSFYTLSA